jgi:hypothetical protein
MQTVAYIHRNIMQNLRKCCDERSCCEFSVMFYIQCAIYALVFKFKMCQEFLDLLAGQSFYCEIACALIV